MVLVRGKKVKEVRSIAGRWVGDGVIKGRADGDGASGVDHLAYGRRDEQGDLGRSSWAGEYSDNSGKKRITQGPAKTLIETGPYNWARPYGKETWKKSWRKRLYKEKDKCVES